MPYEYAPQGDRPLDCRDIGDFAQAVTRLHFKIRKVEGGVHGPWCPFAYPLPEPSDPFAPFDTLTAEQVIGWIPAKVIEELEGKADRKFAQAQADAAANAGPGAPASWSA